MELRDVVEVLAGLDDERRAITNSVQRALDALERAVLPAERFGIVPARIDALRERIQHGHSESALLQEMGDQVRERLVEDAKLEGEKLALLAIDDRGMARTKVERLASRLGGALDHARRAHEQVGAVRALLARRRDVDASLARLHQRLSSDEITQELLALTLQARQLGERSDPLGARQFLLDAENAASASGLLAGVASNARALREALRVGRAPEAIAEDLRQRTAEAAARLWADREEARRQLAQVEREAERRQEISHGMFQAVTKATEVLERLDRFERLPASQRLADGALGPLKAACLEHGIISVLVGLHEVRVERGDLDSALSQLSQALGDLLGLLRDRREETDMVVPAWDDIAAVEARTQETEWESACREAMGVRRDAQGLLAVSPETLGMLVSADSLTPFRDRLFQRVEAKMGEVLRATERLEALDRVLSDLCDEGGELAEQSLKCKAALTSFIGEALHVMGECHARFRERLHAPETGFGQVEARVAAFQIVEEAGVDDQRTRMTLVGTALAELRTLFAELEMRLPGGGASAADTRKADERLKAQATSLQHGLAASLASLTKLRELLLPPLPTLVEEAIGLAERLRAGSADTGLSRDRLGEALESLLHERLYHEALDLETAEESRSVALLVSERNRRLLAIVGASLNLAFRLLGALAREHDALPEPERPAHLDWMDELVHHVRGEMALFARLFDRVLMELPDNATRRERHGIALDAYATFLAEISRTEAGAALTQRHEDLLEAFELPLAQVGGTLLATMRPDEADWRATSQLESVIELQEMILHRLREVGLQPGAIAILEATRARAIAMREEILARAEGEPAEGRAGNSLFR